MTIISIYIFFSLQLALTIMTVISCLRFTTGSSLPTTTEELGFLKTDGNHTTWTISPLKPLRQQHQSLRTLCKPHTKAQLIKMLNELGAKSYAVTIDDTWRLLGRRQTNSPILSQLRACGHQETPQFLISPFVLPLSQAL